MSAAIGSYWPWIKQGAGGRAARPFPSLFFPFLSTIKPTHFPRTDEQGRRPGAHPRVAVRLRGEHERGGGRGDQDEPADVPSRAEPVVRAHWWVSESLWLVHLLDDRLDGAAAKRSTMSTGINQRRAAPQVQPHHAGCRPAEGRLLPALPRPGVPGVPVRKKRQEGERMWKMIDLIGWLVTRRCVCGRLQSNTSSHLPTHS